MRSGLIAAVVFASAAAAAPANAAVVTTATLEPFSATYAVTRGRMTLGRMQVSLDRTDGGSWLYRSYTRTTGLASLIRDVRVHETTRFRIVHGRLVPYQHVYTLTGDRRDRNFALVFDWIAREVRGIVEGEEASAELVPGAVDRHTLGLATVLHVVGDHGFPRRAVVVDRARVRELEMRLDGTQQLRTQAGTFDTIRIVQQRVDDPDKRFVMHVAPALHHIPVRVQSQDDDGATVTIELLEYRFP